MIIAACLPYRSVGPNVNGPGSAWAQMIGPRRPLEYMSTLSPSVCACVCVRVFLVYAGLCPCCSSVYFVMVFLRVAVTMVGGDFFL